MLTGCADEPGCGEPDEIEYFSSGEYSAPAGAPVNHYCSPGCGTVFTPHDGVDDFNMDLDLAQDIATITYTRDGKQVVERWRITSRTSR